MDTLNELKSFHKTTIFYLAAMSICRKKGIKYNFVCPLCGGKAHAKITVKSAILRAYCDDCKVNIREY